MKRPRFTGLRARLLLSTFVGSLLAVSILVAAFNLVLDGRLRGEVDNLLRDRAAAQLRTVSVIDGRLRVPEALDRGALDTQTWIFAGRHALEQPVSTPQSQRAALALSGGTRRFLTVKVTHTRLYAVPIFQESRGLGTIVVGASLSPYDSSARAALIGSLILGALTVLGIAAVSTWVTRRALAPVAQMTAAAADWGEHDLSRRFFAGEPHDELTELAATFDRLLERLSQSFKREQRFTAEISHELRTPLAKILAEAELTATDRRSGAPPGAPPTQPSGLCAPVVERTPERYQRALDSIHASAESLSRVLDALLVTARAHTAGAGRSTDARTVAEQTARNTSSTASERGITIEVTESAPGARVAAEANLVERALTPIIENAARFARHRVDIAIRTDTGKVIFEIHDDGPGVDPAIREQIFEPGVSQGQDRAGSGAGLGLPLARRLAHAAGGEIDHIPVGVGATFALRLPSG